MKLKLRIIIFLLQCSMAGFSQTAPGGVSANLRIWLKPEVGITTSGTNVSNWADQSGIATPNNFDQTNATAQPTLTAAAAVYNFHPAINFVTNKFLRSRVVTNAPFTADNLNGTLHVVLNKTSVAGAQDTFGFGGSTTGAAVGTANTPVMGATNGNPYWYDGDWPNASTIPMTAGKTHIEGFSWRYNVAGSGILSLDGKNEVTAQNPNLILTAQGAILGSQPEEFNGLMQEVIAYERELTLAEKQRVNSYLAIKYGITLDQSVAQNYLDSGSGIMWNATLNATYKNNIAGIGRDDTSVLNQKQSQSVDAGFQVTMGLTTIEPSNAGNTATFAADKNFMVWGDDGAAATFSTPTSNGHGVDTRYTRIWKIQETGTVGIVKFAVPSTIGASGKVYLVRSTNTTFDAADEYIPLTTYTSGSNSYLACDINFNTGDFFTLATNTNPATIALSITPATATVAEGSTQIVKVGFPTGITLVTNTIADYTITGTGINGTDCTTLSGSVTIPAGQNSVDINVAALSDNVLETNETITLTGTTVTSIEGSEWTTVAANKTTTVTITDANPASDKFLSFVPTTISTPEGTATSVVVSLPSGITAVNDITFNYAVSGTASSGSDFTALSGTGTIVAGQNSVSIAVTPLTDSIIEPNETIILTGGTITGSPLTGFTWSSSANTSTITITDVTSAASKILNITPTTVSVAEGSPTTLTVSLPTGITVASPLVVSYTVSGTATSGTDYNALTGSVTIPAGSGSATITVAALTDSLIEANETVIVTGGTTAGYSWGSSDVATVTITDVSNAASKVLSITTATVSIVEGGSTTLTISLPTGVIVASPLTVSYTVSGTATSATDYNALSGTVIIPAGSGSTTITVASLSDSSIEPDETVILTGGTTSGFTWNASASTSTVTITDVTSPANKTLSFSPTTVSTAEGTTTVLTVSLPTGITSTSPITADYTVTGTATSGTDYTALTGSVTIPAGQNSITINMSALTDGAIESNETVILTGGTITATPLTGFTWNVSANTVTVTITDVIDPASKVLSITPSTLDVAEGSNTILTISLPTGVTTANALVVNYTVSGTAISGTDYTALIGSVTIPAGQGSATITLAASADSLIESSETVIITGATTGGFTWNPSANISTITITDVTNAANKVLSITPATVSTAEGTATVLTVSLPTGITTATSIVVNYIVSGTATSATDYTALSGSVIIPAGQGSATINVSALTDGIIESDETVVVTGGTTSGFTWSPSASSSTVTITDVTSAANKVLSIIPTTVNVAEGSNTALTVSLPTGVTTANALVVNYTIGGTATSDTDYTALTGSVTIPAGQGSATINVSSSSDSIIESSETVTVTGNTTVDFTWSPSASSSTVTITDVTSVASRVLSINPTSVSTDEGTSTDLTVSLPTGVTTAAALIVNYTIAGTATSATDYTALTGSVTIPAGSGSATITIAALSDSAIESDETVVVTGGTTAGFTWSPTNNISTVTITNVDDPASKVLSFSPITISTAEGSSSLITVRLPTGITTATAVVVNYTVSGTATSGSDYTALSGTVTIGAGQNSGTINVSALTDGVIESDETVILTEGVTPGFTWNASANSATVTLTDATGNNPANKVLSILPTTTNVVEGASTNLTVSLPTGITVSSLLLVNYTVSGTATGTTDYAALSGTVTIAAGQNSATINISSLTDNILESNETVILTGGNTNGYTWGINNVSTVTINDATGNNPANKVLTITPDAVNVDEGMATTLTVSLPNSIITANPLIVNYTVSGTATSATDYTALTGSVTIHAGSSSATINVATLTDSAIESDETIVVTGAITSGFTWNPSANTSTVTIKNVDDPANKVLSFSPITTSVLEGGLSTITVSLPTGVSTAVALAVNYTISGTALSASDYRLLSGTVTIGAGQNSATISISTLADGVIETDETVILTGGTTPSFTWNVAANTAIVTITDATGNNPANKVLSIVPTTATVAEGATTNLTVSLPTGITTAQDLNVNYTLSGTAGISDFRPLTGTVIIPAGSGSFTIPVEALNDGAIESPETIVFTGAETSSFTWGVRNVATVTITDETGNNPANKVLSILPATMNVSEGNSTSLIISLPNGITTDNSLIVNYAIGGTASKDSDFGSLTGKVTIPAGANSVSLDVATLNDLVLESDETIVVTGAATNGFTWGSNNVSTITITDETGNNPANKVLSILPEISSISEGSSTNLVISLPSGITTGVAQVVNYNIGGTTDDGVDYATLTGTATIPAGSNSVTIPVRALTDRVLESDETVELEGAVTSGFTWDIFANKASVAIIDLEREDTNNRIVSISSGTAYLDEGSVILTASLPSGITATEDIYVNLDNVFSSYSDLIMSNFVIIPAGQNSAEFEVKVGSKRKNNESIEIKGNVNDVIFETRENELPNYQFTLEPGKIIIKNDLIEVADAVSANGDGINDYFAIGNIEKYKDNTVTIVDRWGVEVFKVRGYDNQSTIFDGQFRGKDLENGTYFYFITIVRKQVEHQYKGFLVLKR